ncbi:putative D-3-phosphoglycerate dehydrogenase [Hortaea werneckii]|nr:putative D-3-phosphoglycerate dehydrogenase [Hortaea werneckii]KAI6828072.1 putative D-3-phosphoglycerate dehydrogenase [Hortaea werneckii]KAI6852213.1 putative D-3-phosphoglycerate dehydrogenase [Hortaea werneckii]KAI6943824.1 putative D-3-phosphoglycerate dehydrogenase [Hortaea werneckii]KAI6949510.1 putative D-3-phosphoglycerate dehydrogenase [Hortaea werneckii]
MAPALIQPEATDFQDDCIIHHESKPTVYMLDNFHPSAVQHAQNLFHVILPTDPEIHNWKERAQYVLVRSSALPAETISAARNLRAIGKQGVGIDKINEDACRERGIAIFNTPGVNASAVAELTLALTMAVARDIGSIHGRMCQGEVVKKETCSGLILSGKTIGLIGMGNIGKAVARMFHGAFAADIIAYDPYMPDDAWNDLQHTRASSVDDILVRADVLSIHVPLTPSTKGLIGYKEMQSMKSNAIIINAARGGIVDEQDLVRAVQDGLIWGAGLDCHEQEPPTKERYGKLWSTGRIISTPHIGAATSQTQMETAIAAVDRLYKFAGGMMSR